MKGYGKFDTKNDDPTGPYTVFAGDPTDAENTKVEVQGFSNDDLTNLQGDGITDPDAVNSFYWGPTATGNETVKILAIVENNRTGARMTLKSSTVTNVVKPTGTIALDPTQNPNPAGGFFPALGTTGVNSSRTRLGFDANFAFSAAPSPHGIDWRASVNTFASGVAVTGQFDVVQTMTYWETKIYKNFYGTLVTQTAGNLPDGSNPGIVLDTAFGYEGATPVGTPIRTNDSPGSGLARATAFETPDSLNRRDYFTLTLIFKPSGGIWIPIGQLPWNWGGTAVFTAGAWSLQSGTQSAGSYAPSTAFPTWTHNVTEVLGKFQ